MKHLIRNNNTGTFYDIRIEANTSILDQEINRLTILSKTSANEPWEGDKEEKAKRNRQFLFAAENGDVNRVIDLLNASKHGNLVASISEKGLDGYTALHFAATGGHLEVIKVLIKAKANANALSHSLRTPLHLACEKGFIDIIKYLLMHGADIDAQDDEGNTPLHYLSTGGWEEGVKLLLAHNCNANIKNSYKESAVELAKDLRIRDLLMGKGKDETMMYARIVMNNVILHNNRVDTIRLILLKAQQLNFGSKSEQSPIDEERIVSSYSNREQPRSRRSKLIEAVKRFSTLGDMSPTSLYNKGERITLNNLSVINFLGKGSFAKVYLVKHNPTNRLFAMKSISKEQVLRAKILRYIQAERSILCSVKSPFIVKIEAALQNTKKLFLLLQYCPGYSDYIRLIEVT